MVFNELEKRGVNIKSLNALEVFGSSGDFHTKDYAKKIHSLEVWEIDPKYEDLLKKNLPNARIKITDSYKEIKRCKEGYDMIVIDNPWSTFGEHCEHFDLFPYVFRIAADSSILITNVIPKISAEIIREYPYLFNKEQLEYRKAFFKTTQPDNVSFDKMIEVYDEIIKGNNFNLQWYFFQKRSFFYYLVLKIRSCTHITELES
jgi:hypothetical protein